MVDRLQNDQAKCGANDSFTAGVICPRRNHPTRHRQRTCHVADDVQKRARANVVGVVRVDKHKRRGRGAVVDYHWSGVERHRQLVPLQVRRVVQRCNAKVRRCRVVGHCARAFDGKVVCLRLPGHHGRYLAQPTHVPRAARQPTSKDCQRDNTKAGH